MLKPALKNIFYFFFVLLIVFLSNPRIVCADGMLIDPDPYSDRWDYSEESYQQAFINYENGFEKLIINVGFNQNNKDVFWVFPVPANPQKTVVDIVTTLPNFRGEDINLKAKMNLDDTKTFLQSTQIYPLLISGFFGITLLNTKVDVATPGFGSVGRVDLSGGQKDVIVYEHLEKEGITSEIITAKTPLGLTQYFEDKGFKFESQSVRALNHYIGKDFAFVVSWISKPASNKYVGNVSSLQKGVFVTFPTNKLFYPLIPTSVYESKIIPTSIRIIGYVSPEVFNDIKSYTEIKYYIDENLTIGNELDNFYKNKDRAVPYTLIKVDSPSKLLSDDLWISRSVPLKTYIPSFISQHPYITSVLLLIVFSFATGAITGWLLMAETRNIKGLIKFGLVGLGNCLSLVGLIIVVLKTDIRRKSFVVVFSLIFLFFSWIFIMLLERSFNLLVNLI